MTHALVTQMLEALERVNVLDDDCDIFFEPLANAVTESITAAREYLATEPSGELAQSAEPVAWVNFARKKPTAKSLSFSRELTIFEKANGFVSNPLYLHPPQPQATYSDSTPLLHVGNSSFEDWFQERDRAGKSDKQLAREAYAAGMGDPLVTYAAAQGEKP